MLLSLVQHLSLSKHLTQIKTSLLGPADALATSKTFWFVVCLLVSNLSANVSTQRCSIAEYKHTHCEHDANKIARASMQVSLWC